MTATEGSIKPQSISDDVRAIEEALAAGPTQGPWHVEPQQEDGRWEICTSSPGAWILDVRSTSEATETERAEDLANVELMAACDPDRLRRVLDTMQAMVEALRTSTDALKEAELLLHKVYTQHGIGLIDDGGGALVSVSNAADRMDGSIDQAAAALALYEGKQ